MITIMIQFWPSFKDASLTKHTNRHNTEEKQFLLRLSQKGCIRLKCNSYSASLFPSIRCRPLSYFSNLFCSGLSGTYLVQVFYTRHTNVLEVAQNWFSPPMGAICQFPTSFLCVSGDITCPFPFEGAYFLYYIIGLSFLSYPLFCFMISGCHTQYLSFHYSLLYLHFIQARA